MIIHTMLVFLPLLLVTLDVYLWNMLSAMQSMSLAFCSGTCWYVVDDDDEEVEEDTDSNLANVFNARNNRILVVGGFVSVEVNVVLRERNGSGVQGRMAMYNVGVVGFCWGVGVVKHLKSVTHGIRGLLLRGQLLPYAYPCTYSYVFFFMNFLIN